MRRALPPGEGRFAFDRERIPSGPRLTGGAVHQKDRFLAGTTPPLGRGARQVFATAYFETYILFRITRWLKKRLFWIGSAERRDPGHFIGFENGRPFFRLNWK